MKDVRSYLEREQRRLSFYRFLWASVLFCLLGAIEYQLLLLSPYYLLMFKWTSLHESTISMGLVVSLVLIIAIVAIRIFKSFKPITFSQLAETLEAQNSYFTSNKKARGELRSAGYFLDQSDRGDVDGNSEDFKAAHIKFWNKRSSKIAKALLPSPLLLWGASLAIVLGHSTYSIYLFRSHSLPRQNIEWTPGEFEIQSTGGSEWKKESGSLSGIEGSRVRFLTPSFHSLQTFLYVKEIQKPWALVVCSEYCELKLNERGQYAVGTLLGRSSLFPLISVPDESPKGVLLVKVSGEFTPATLVDVLNKESIDLEANASDDVAVKKVEFIHRGPESSDEEIIHTWVANEKHFKKTFSLPLKGWNGGKHDLFLRIYDEFKFAESGLVSILFADEETMRAKRIQDLRALLDEWVHVLADLIETQHDQKLHESLLKRFSEMTYPEVAEESLINAFVKELKLLADRIQRWAKFSPDFSQVKDLVSRTERQILYGLSLVFQEKTGEIESTADSLKSSQNNLQDLLEKIKKGEMDVSSKELEEAFKSLASKIEELQNKIKELPNGPNEDMINREALENQLEESESLADKIEAIKKQMASGDSKGAMRELESLLNQLSILSKEMQRSLDQWQGNLDKGAVQSSQKFAKQLEDIIKKQEAIQQNTERLKDESEKLEEQNAKTWKPLSPEKMEALQKKFSELKEKQDKLGQELKRAVEDYDKMVEGTEWEQVLRPEESRQMEQDAQERMGQARDSLGERKPFDAISSEKEAAEILKKVAQKQRDIQKQMQSQANASKAKTKPEKIEVIGSEAKGLKERRKKIMESLQQKVDEKFQKSHEGYFEEILQR